MDAFESYFQSLKGKKIAVLGLGVSNRPLVRLLLEFGCDVVGCDKTPREKLDDEVLALEGAPPGLEPEQQVLDTLGAEELTRMILDLREPYKTPCRLVLLEQHTMAEAARLCGRPEKTVNAQIYRAKKMLVQQIREQQEGRSVHGTV